MTYREEPVGETPAEGRRFALSTIVGLGGVGLLVVFCAQNTNDVRLDFLWLSFTWPLWLLCLVMAFVGAMVWFGAGVLRRHRRRVRRRAARRA